MPKLTVSRLADAKESDNWVQKYLETIKRKAAKKSAAAEQQ